MQSSRGVCVKLLKLNDNRVESHKFGLVLFDRIATHFMENSKLINTEANLIFV
jgi:hypothetical protein